MLAEGIVIKNPRKNTGEKAHRRRRQMAGGENNRENAKMNGGGDLSRKRARRKGRYIGKISECRTPTRSIQTCLGGDLRPRQSQRPQTGDEESGRKVGSEKTSIER